MKQKINIVTILLVCSLASCTVYKDTMLSVNRDPFSAKLGNLDYEFVAENVSDADSSFIDDIVRAEIMTNVIQKSSGKPGGMLKVSCREIVKSNGGISTLFMPQKDAVKLVLYFSIHDTNGDEIKGYQYTKSGKSSLTQSLKVQVLELAKAILTAFKANLNEDYEYIASRLTKSSDMKGIPVELYAQKPKDNPVQKGEIEDKVTPQNVPIHEVVSVKQERILSDVDRNIPEGNKKSDNTFVLIIANEDYQFVDDVQYALNDGKTFKEYCVKTLGVPEKQVWLYENASYGVINAGVSKMIQALNMFNKPNAIIYYCGHGIPDEKTGDAYIIPTDGNGKNMATCYSLNSLYKTFSSTGAGNITYFMDACFTGANKDGSMLVAARGVAREPKKEVLSGNTVVFSATSSDETAMAYDEKQHGLFTYYLLKKLQETKGEVSYAELSEYIQDNVKKEAFLTNEKVQTPVVATSPAIQSQWGTLRLK